MNVAYPVLKVTRLFGPIAKNFDKHIAVQEIHDFDRKIFEEDKIIVEA